MGRDSACPELVEWEPTKIRARPRCPFMSRPRPQPIPIEAKRLNALILQWQKQKLQVGSHCWEKARRNRLLLLPRRAWRLSQTRRSEIIGFILKRMISLPFVPSRVSPISPGSTSITCRTDSASRASRSSFIWLRIGTSARSTKRSPTASWTIS